MLNKLRLWRLERRIAHLERMEAEAAASLQHLRIEVLPKLRQQRNDMLPKMGRKEQRWYERTPNGSHDYAVYDQPYPEHASCYCHVNDLAYYRARFDLQPCWEPGDEHIEIVE